MELVTVAVGIVILIAGVRQETSGAGLPLIVAGACLTLFGVAWFLGNRFEMF
jgi:hypothetical protein